MGKAKKAKYYTYQRMALVLALVFLVLALCFFSLRYLWSPSLGKVRLNISSLFATHPPNCLLLSVAWEWEIDERHPESPHQQTIQVTSKGKNILERKMDDHTKSQRQYLQSVLYSARLKDVWAMEKATVFCSAHVLAVRSVISWICGLNHKPLIRLQMLACCIYPLSAHIVNFSLQWRILITQSWP